MEKEIDGKVYKDIPVVKMIVNGKEIQGNVISAEDASDESISLTIITEPEEENKK
ncbi:hypothetical protein KPL37_10000 [Clostridium frigoris]|uniref:Uncharacterized protein n=1 Tax=Clostridium frigoris TaxID=205327 RepID=A0ABS6BT39_9CLOT|nr:hypothetical protein [Clostridium frigoris]MBU3160085.1 hypothetical protein [Clostridium frigoris]